MIWVILLLGVIAVVWFLLAPRRLQTIENVPAVVDEKLKATDLVETTEDPREITPMALEAAHRVSDIPPEGHGDSLTFDWPNDQTEPHTNRQHAEGPLNQQ
jgi:hypothetical protein